MKIYLVSAFMALSLLLPQTLWGSDAGAGEVDLEESLTFGTHTTPIATFTSIFFGKGFDAKQRLAILASLHQKGQGDKFLSNEDFQKQLLGVSDDAERNSLIHRMPDAIKNPFKGNIFDLTEFSHGLRILESLGTYEVEQIAQSLKNLSELNANFTPEEREGMLSVVTDPSARDFLAHLMNVDNNAVSDTTELEEATPKPSFLEIFFKEQQGKVNAIAAELGATKKAYDREVDVEEKQRLQGEIIDLTKRLYAAKNPEDFSLRNFADSLLFTFSDDYALLDLSRHFIIAALERDLIILSRKAATYDEASPSIALAKTIDMFMLKTQTLAGAAVTLNEIITIGIEAPEAPEAPEALHNRYMTFGNFFIKYVQATPEEITGDQLFSAREELAVLLASFISDPLPDLLTPRENAGASASAAAVTGPTVAQSARDLEGAGAALGALALEQNSLEVATIAGLTAEAKFVGEAAIQETDPAKKALLMHRLLAIKAEIERLV